MTALRSAGGRTLAECDVWLDRDGAGRAVEGTAVVELDGRGARDSTE